VGVFTLVVTLIGLEGLVEEPWCLGDVGGFCSF
jgi:hypothetical protein